MTRYAAGNRPRHLQCFAKLAAPHRCQPLMMLRATPAPAARECAAFHNAAAPHRWNQPPFSAGRQAPRLRTNRTVTTTQCVVMRTSPPPAQSSGTRRPGVRSQSLAALHAIVCSYLLPVECRRRSAPASLRRVMAQAAWPSGAAIHDAWSERSERDCRKQPEGGDERSERVNHAPANRLRPSGVMPHARFHAETRGWPVQVRLA
jgi:hypothetical protein